MNSKYTNTLWASADGHNWHQSLPPMPTCRRWPTVLSSTSPECLIVIAGDVHIYDRPDDRIEVLSHGEWKSVHLPLALQADDVTGTLHYGSLCLYYVFAFGRSCVDIYCCKVDSLLASCTRAGENEIVWKTIASPPAAANYTRETLLSFEQHLLAVQAKSAYVYSPNTESWVLMDENSFSGLGRSAITFADHTLFKTPKYWCKATLKGAICIIIRTSQYLWKFYSLII